VPPPFVGVAVKVIELPAHSGLAPLVKAILTLAADVALTVAVVVDVFWQLLASVTVTEYVPVAALVALVIVGF